ncbi:DUF1440 domain-containing protein [Phototrophicus methaneseepsis]|uniref:DUF1440 domain-containing protein n=1 Tax=Phototrophicus methaneseepsis TaxID=2710758 RepID=UPI001E5F55F7|nr:DUF1440 domain-containing protein [Phototrophicus methaneseepsis]
MAWKNMFIKGAFAGLIATVPMTISMMAMRRWLPWWQKGPLPPHEVTRNTLRAMNLDAVEDKHHLAATVAAHFSYGAGVGALYPFVDQLPLPNMLKGSLYGIGVWMFSYLGWLPATGILEPATEKPSQRNVLMIVAHVVWGVGLSFLFDNLYKGQPTYDIVNDHKS